MATNRTYPENNLQDTNSLSLLKARSIDFVERFSDDLSDFRELLGVTRQFPVQNGFTIKFYSKPEVTLADGKVPEGELIPLSKVTPKEHSSKELSLEKYRKVTTIEAIQKYGRSNAIQMTDDHFLKEIQNRIRAELFTALKTDPKETTNQKPGSLQGALATAWGALQVAFENNAVSPIAFAHPMDVAQQLADKNVTVDSRFGLNYYTDVTGTKVITSTQIPEGKIFATVPENLVLAYVPSTSEAFSEFDLRADQTGYIGVTHEVEKRTLTTETVAAYGLLLYPERLDGVLSIDLTPAL